jgi:hypothetical protein
MHTRLDTRFEKKQVSIPALYFKYTRIEKKQYSPRWKNNKIICLPALKKKGTVSILDRFAYPLLKKSG